MNLKGRYVKMSLCISPHSNICSPKKSLSGHCLQKNTYTHMQIHRLKETSLHTFRKGSLTVEAAFVIPLVAGVLVSVLFFLRILQVQAAVDEALAYAGRKAAAESSITDSEAALFLSAEFFFLQILEQYDCVEDYVEYGSLGISLLSSDFSGEDILLRAEYSMKFPISFLDFGRIWLWQQNSFRKWTGSDVSAEEDYVYVSRTGEVYHASSDCRSIQISVQETSYENIGNLRGADGQKYYACSACADRINEGRRVYYTEYGTLYHGDVSCSALKRTVTKIPLSEVGERRKCSYCY